MKPFKKSQVAKTTTSRKEYKIVTTGMNIPYWDEGYYYYNSTKHNKKKRLLLMYQVRMYKTWKHNRKNQWKS
ncbi:hypothetical protein M0Q97_03855 [Candidatus Dojkabacteria bacterium]|jgi:hypothetical protein|nr:hypothetical protein [Candidatus Dojkabacteria bacterium]